MRNRGLSLLAALAAVSALTVGLAGSASSEAPSYNWPAILPPDPSPTQPQIHPVQFCRKATIKCVRTQIARMVRRQRHLGCDHRAVFMTTYLELTRELYETVRRNPHFFRYPRYFFAEDALFANVYFRTLKAWGKGGWVPPAWRIALETARSGEVNGAQEMLLGINAHVQNDMPFVLASLGLRSKRGASRKHDHDAANDVLNSGYERVVAAITNRYDPTVAYTNSPLTPLDDIAGLELTKSWRERVWRNAERLVNAKDAAERRAIATEIQSYAADWARGIASTQTPGSRERRDAYCRERLGR